MLVSRYLRRPLALAAFCVLGWSLLQDTVAEDWPGFRGPRHNGISSETAWVLWEEGGPTVAWQTNVGVGYSSVAIRDGKLYTLGNSDETDTLVCLDVQTGQVVWKHSYPSPRDDRLFEGGPTATPCVDADAVYSLGRQGDVFCCDTRSGEVRWHVQLTDDHDLPAPGWGFGGSPVVQGELLLLNAGSAGVALFKATGELRWKSEPREAGYTTPVIVRTESTEVMVVASGREYSGVAVENGELLWRHRWLTRFGCNAADPLVADDQVLISSAYNRGSALLDLGTGQPQEVWRHKDYQNQFSSSILREGYVYGLDGATTTDTQLRCLDFASGTIVWSQPWQGMGSLTAAGDRLLVLSEEGELTVVAASPKAYRPLASARVLEGTSWTAPVLCNGRLYCRNSEGDLVCLDLRAKASQQPRRSTEQDQDGAAK